MEPSLNHPFNFRSFFTNSKTANVGLGVEHRVWRNLWLRAEAGASGFRGFGFIGSDWKGPNSDAGTSPYLSLSLNFRPGGPAKGPAPMP